MCEIFFSLIVPAFNVEKYLVRCMESLLSQSFTDYEVIIVDDGSTDETAYIANKYLERRCKINVVHQTNKGLGGARNTGINVAKGKYLVFIDGDDFVSNDMLEKAFFYITNYALDIFVFGFELVKEGNLPSNKKIEDNFRIIEKSDYLIKCGPSAWNKIYKRSIFINGNIRYPEKLLYEDVATTPLTVLKANKIGLVDSKLYYYVQRLGSIIASPNLERVFEILQGFEDMVSYFRKYDSDKVFKEELEFLAILHILYYTDKRIILAGGKINNFERIDSFMHSLFPNFVNNKFLKDAEVIKCNNIDTFVLNMLIKRKYLLAKWKAYPLINQKRLVKYILCGMRRNEK